MRNDKKNSYTLVAFSIFYRYSFVAYFCFSFVNTNYTGHVMWMCSVFLLPSHAAGNAFNCIQCACRQKWVGSQVAERASGGYPLPTESWVGRLPHLEIFWIFSVKIFHFSALWVLFQCCNNEQRVVLTLGGPEIRGVMGSCESSKGA